MIRLAALFCGLLCGTGLMLSGLFQPTLLQDFLNPDGARDLTLGIGLLSVLGAGLLVLALTRRLSRPLLGGQGETLVEAPTRKALLGGVLFGFGWGLSGFFPLAALAAIGLFAPGAAIFLASMLVGMILHDIGANRGRFRLVRLRSSG
ncbi:MAG: hypothetical protein O9292_13155 [Rhodobacteraceae bacterium]|jgi:uncharacterized membrane protein YedE/YeeE|nr:hypothetical protein [Paracoccaceae bacterium]MCZ8336375.1 hypothetical protein [Paracoccaceae bacterium]